jgi:hypothetical protein
MLDPEYCWVAGKNGHAFYLNGPADVGAFGRNSWKRFGIKNVGLFKVRSENYKDLFSCYSITVSL